jgi:hypothetical protein
VDEEIHGQEATVPSFRSQSSSEDWRQHLYNQERMLSTQDQLVDVLEKLLKQQEQMGQMAAKLDVHLNLVSKAMDESSKATSGFVAGVIKVPIAMAVVVAASWAFMYAKEISENTWLIMLGVAVFPWLGESITAIWRLIRGGPDRVQTGDAK